MIKRTVALLFIFLFISIGFAGVSLADGFVREVAKKWDGVAVAPDSNWFAQDLGPSDNSQRHGIASHFDAPVKHTFEFSCPTATVINLQLKYNAATKVFTFNSGNAIGGANGHQFSVILHSGMTYNIQHKTGTQACAVVITESFNVDL